MTAVTTPAIWAGSAGDHEWTTPGNWLANAIPTAGQDVVINASGQSIDLSAPESVGSMEVSDATLLTDTMTIHGNLWVDGDFTYRTPVVFAGNVSMEVAPATTLVYQGGVSDNNSGYAATIAGGGSVDLRSGGFTLEGGTTVTDGSTIRIATAVISPIVLQSGTVANALSNFGTGPDIGWRDDHSVRQRT